MATLGKLPALLQQQLAGMPLQHSPSLNVLFV